MTCSTAKDLLGITNLQWLPETNKMWKDFWDQGVKGPCADEHPFGVEKFRNVASSRFQSVILTPEPHWWQIYRAVWAKAVSSVEGFRELTV